MIFKSLAKKAASLEEFKKELTHYIILPIAYTAIYLTIMSDNDLSDCLKLLLTGTEIAFAVIIIHGTALARNPKALARYYKKFH